MGWGGCLEACDALKKMISPTKILPKALAWVCDLYAGSTNLLFRHCSVLFALCNGRWSKPSAEESCPFVGLTASPCFLQSARGAVESLEDFAWWRGCLRG